MASSWKKWGSTAIVLSEAVDLKNVPTSKGYSISKTTIDNELIYELWELPKQTKLGTFKNANDAKRFCMDAQQNKSTLPDGKA